MLYNKVLMPARGLVVLRAHEETETKTRAGLVLPRKGATPREMAEYGDAVSHIRGTVVRIGPPALTDSGVEMPLDGLAPGDDVVVRTGWNTSVHIIDDVVHYLVPQQAIGGRLV